jgi:hypothetical protein
MLAKKLKITQRSLNQDHSKKAQGNLCTSALPPSKEGVKRLSTVLKQSHSRSSQLNLKSASSSWPKLNYIVIFVSKSHLKNKHSSKHATQNSSNLQQKLKQ